MATQAAQWLMSHPLFVKAERIGCYLAESDEFDCAPIIDAVFACHKKCYLPVLDKDKKRQLLFSAYKAGDALTKNRYQILEPAVLSIFPVEQLDLVIVPLLGFDLSGTRLGRGGGYYDATFSFLLNSARGKPFLLGLAYSFQQMPVLAADPWDVKLDGVLTEQGVIVF